MHDAARRIWGRDPEDALDIDRPSKVLSGHPDSIRDGKSVRRVGHLDEQRKLDRDVWRYIVKVTR